MLRCPFSKKDGHLLSGLFCATGQGHTHTHTKAKSTHTHRNTKAKSTHTNTKAKSTHTHRHTRHQVLPDCWAEARVKIARMTLTIKLDGNWSSFQLANCAPPLGVTDSAIAPSARMLRAWHGPRPKLTKKGSTYLSSCFGAEAGLGTHTHTRHHPQEEATKVA